VIGGVIPKSFAARARTSLIFAAECQCELIEPINR
jgi:hypothetical protein